MVGNSEVTYRLEAPRGNRGSFTSFRMTVLWFVECLPDSGLMVGQALSGPGLLCGRPESFGFLGFWIGHYDGHTVRSDSHAFLWTSWKSPLLNRKLVSSRSHGIVVDSVIPRVSGF
jgi:hypothetical protein